MLVDRLQQSQEFEDFDLAFREVTGLPLGITSADQVRFALCSKHEKARTTFCSLMVQDGHHCDTCRKLHRNIESEMGLGEQELNEELLASDVGLTAKRPEIVEKLPGSFGHSQRTFECFAGLCETLIPIEVGGRLIAFLQTGQVLLHQPTKSQFKTAVSKIEELWQADNVDQLEEAYFNTPVVPPNKYRAMVQLLKSFVPQIAELIERYLLEEDSREPKIVSYAKSFIRENYDCPLTLDDVALEVGSSPFHLSHRFKETTGTTFIEYLARVRIARVKKLLRDRSKRITEIAFEVGFQSLAPFNRAFKRFEGMSPKQYRERLLESEDRN